MAVDIERPAAAIGGGELPAAFDAVGMSEALRDLFDPRSMVSELPRLLWELTRVIVGTAEAEFPPQKDRRFADPTWSDNPVYRRLGQGYVTWASWLERQTHNHRLDPGRRARAGYLAQMLTAAAAPTNVLPGNPAALKRAFETAGLSLLRGARHFFNDLLTNGGLPSQVDRRPFRVGVNLAATPGAVVHREEMFELLQYAPTTPVVRERPLLMVPPQINRYYFLDLAPGRSLVEYTVAQGVQFFTISWRNARPEHGTWSLEHYVAAVLRAIAVVLNIAGSDDLNLLGVCAGGLTSGLTLGHLTAIGRRVVHAAAFMVTMIDSRYPNVLSTTATPRVLAQFRERAARGEVYSSRSMARSFAWMRPQDLIFTFVVNNWLLGNDPPAFDIMAWNVDMANLAGAFQRDLMTIYADNLAAEPGRLTILGAPIDLSRATCDTFILAGATDHITPWRACYMTSQVLGGESEVIVARTGHILAIVNPPGEQRARFRCGPRPGPDPDEWFAQADEHQGSWWPRWSEWLIARSGGERPAPSQLGSPAHVPGDPAPGRYIHEA